MTSSTGAENSPTVPGVLAEQEGVILQRGGEELAIDKLNDRFTVGFAAMSLDELTARLEAKSIRQIPGVNLAEVQVEPDQLDAAMQQARTLPAIAFASHVYQLQNGLNTLVYLPTKSPFSLTIASLKQRLEQKLLLWGYKR